MLEDKESLDTALANVTPLESILTELGDGEKLVRAIHDEDILVPLAQQLETCALLDHENEAAGASLGEFCYRILSLPLEAQRTITTLLAHQMGIEPPSYESGGGRGRPTKGRDQLAAVIYHAYPDDLVKKGKDSRAGKRITDHVMRYRRRQEEPKPRERKQPKEERGHVAFGRYRSQFQELYGIATREEGILLVRLFRKLGIPINTLNRWTNGRLLENVINITPEPTGSGIPKRD